MLKEIEVIERDLDIEAIRVYLKDTFFYELEEFLKREDYAMAKDATKGLYTLASQLSLFKLYELLLDIYEDLQYEEYNEVLKHYSLMMVEHKELLEVYHD